MSARCILKWCGVNECNCRHQRRHSVRRLRVCSAHQHPGHPRVKRGQMRWDEMRWVIRTLPHQHPSHRPVTTQPPSTWRRRRQGHGVTVFRRHRRRLSTISSQFHGRLAAARRCTRRPLCLPSTYTTIESDRVIRSQCETRDGRMLFALYRSVVEWSRCLKLWVQILGDAYSWKIARWHTGWAKKGDTSRTM